MTVGTGIFVSTFSVKKIFLKTGVSKHLQFKLLTWVLFSSKPGWSFSVYRHMQKDFSVEIDLTNYHCFKTNI